MKGNSIPHTTITDAKIEQGTSLDSKLLITNICQLLSDGTAGGMVVSSSKNFQHFGHSIPQLIPSCPERV